MVYNNIRENFPDFKNGSIIMAEDESVFIDTVEFTGVDESEGSGKGTEDFTKEFSPKQIGSIAKYIEPVSGLATIDTLVELFQNNPDMNVVPVEE